MKLEINPAVYWTVIAVVVVGLVGFWIWHMGTGKFKAQTAGSETTMKKYEQTGQFYTPPAGAPIPRGPGGAPGGAPGGIPPGTMSGPPPTAGGPGR